MAESPSIEVPDPKEVQEETPRYADPDLFFLYGEDPTPGIVGMHPVFEEDATLMQVHIRENDGRLVTEDHRFYPFFYVDDISRLRSFDRSSFKFQELSGDNHYQYLVVCPSWTEHTNILDKLYVEQGYEVTYDEDGLMDLDHRKMDEVYIPGSMQTLFQMQTGMTYFKGMTLDDIHRMQLDIEVYSSTEQFPDADREDDEIIIVTLSDNEGREIVITQDVGHPIMDIKNATGATDVIIPGGEEGLLISLRDTILDIDPDVIEGHNVMDFDLRYILDRCNMHGIRFGIGRDHSEPFTWETTRSFAEKDIDYQMCSINGRNVIDTMFLCMDYDVYAREMSSYGLKYAADHFGVSPDNREYIEGDQISDYWDNAPMSLLSYALDDVRETRGLAEVLSESAFYMSQILPMSYADAERKGTATTIESLFVREYLRQKHSIPKPDDGTQTSGGYTDIYYRGVFDRLVYADVSSLYPSIMVEWECTPGEKDPLDFFQRALDQLLGMRLDMKNEMRDLKHEVKEDQKKLENQEERNNNLPPRSDEITEQDIQEKKDRIELLDAKQSSYKIGINSFYGSLGFAIFSWNNISEADRVAETGQDLLKQMILEIESDGGTIIECDTDGVIFTPLDPETGENKMGLPRDEEAEADYVRSLTERMPKGIEVDHDGSFEKAISYKKKNYALKKYGQDPEDMKIKGSSLMSRSNEPFGRKFVDRVLQALIREDVQEIHDIYLEYYHRILESKWDPSEFRKQESLKETFDEYQESVEIFEEKGHHHGGHPRQARFEVAMRDEERGDAEYTKGDQVAYYVAHGPQDSVSRRAKHVRKYDGDEDTEYYMDRLQVFAEKFEDFFDEFAFRRIFSPDDGLFAFDAGDIEIQKERMRPPLSESEEVTVPGKPKNRETVPA